VTGLTSVEQGAALSHPRPEILALTGLRGLAALGVVASQVGVWRTAHPALHHLVAAGALGVPFFFLLSGFVLAYNYPTLSLSAGRRALGRYAMARVARVGPLFVVVGAAVLLLAGVNGGDWVHAVYDDAAWFVGTAVVLYAVFPLLAQVVASSPSVAVVCALAVQVVVLGLRLGSGSDAWLYRNPLVWIPDLVLGMALAGLAARGWRLPRRTAYLVQVGAVVYAVAVVVAFGSSTAVRYSVVWSVPLGLVILSVLTATWTSSLLSTPMMVRLGVIGFALFLLRAIVMKGFGPVHAGSISNALLALCWIGFAVLVAEGAHRYIGAPGRQWVMRLARRLDRRTASTQA
jgi:peptidoglycan/LPS O-acetylase OafA/YrhL